MNGPTVRLGVRVYPMHTYCARQRWTRRCKRCRGWHYRRGTPVHRMTARNLWLTACTAGLYGIVWGWHAVRHRWGATGAWVYTGAWTLAYLIAALT